MDEKTLLDIGDRLSAGHSSERYRDPDDCRSASIGVDCHSRCSQTLRQGASSTSHHIIPLDAAHLQLLVNQHSLA
jgi:hypothetical protein